MKALRKILRKAVHISTGRPLLASPSEPAAPTAAMYFTDPLSPFISLGKPTAERPIARLSPTLFACGATAVVIRYARAQELALLRKGGYRRIFLVIDDHLAVLGPDDGLPGDYRRRQMRYRDGALARLLPMVTHVVAPSEAILASYPGKHGFLLSPSSCYAPGQLAHHRAAPTFEVVIATTRSHLADVAAIATELAEFFQSHPHSRLTTFLGCEAPRPLRLLSNAQHLEAMSFRGFRQFVARHRFHAALAPALPTRFNLARSCSKLHDSAGFGAAGVYAQQPPYRSVIDHGRSGLLVGQQQGSWRAALERLALQRKDSETIARLGQQLSQRIGACEIVSDFWLQRLHDDIHSQVVPLTT